MRSAILFSLLPMLLVGEVSAASYRLTLAQAVDRAISNHQAIDIAQSDKEAAEAKLFSARSAMLPSLTAEYQKIHFDMRGALSSTEKYMPEGWVDSGKITATQTLFTAGKVIRGNQMASIGVEIGKLNYRSTVENLTLATKIHYYNTLYAKKAYEISKESYQNALKNQKELSDRMRFGRASQADQLKMRADVAQREPTLKQAETSYLTALEDLKEGLRLQRSDKLELTEGFEVLTIPTLPTVDIEKVTKNKASLQIIEKGIEVARLSESNAKAAFSPDVAAFVQYNPTRYAKDVSPTDDTHWKNTVNMGVGVTFSFGGDKIGDLKEAVANRYKNEYALKVKQSSFQNDLQNQVLTYQSLLEVYAAAQKSYKLAVESYHLTEALFKSGSISQTYLNDRELQLTQAKQGVAQVQFNLFAVYSKIENLISEGAVNVQ